MKLISFVSVFLWGNILVWVILLALGAKGNTREDGIFRVTVFMIVVSNAIAIAMH